MTFDSTRIEKSGGEPGTFYHVNGGELNYMWVKLTASSKTPTLAKCFTKYHIESSLHWTFSVRSDADKRVESGQERAESARKLWEQSTRCLTSYCTFI